MPTYAYKCFDCGAEFEVSQRMSDEPIKVCESCGGSNVKRLLFASPFQLKGTGWYKTDYASGSSGGGSSSSKTTSSTPVKEEMPTVEKKEKSEAKSGASASVAAVAPSAA